MGITDRGSSVSPRLCTRSVSYTHLDVYKRQVADDAVDADGVEGSLAGVSQTGEDHAADPEADDVVAGNEGVGGVEILEVFALLIGEMLTVRLFRVL